MRGRSLFWHIFPYTLLIAAMAAVGVFIASNRSQRDLLYLQTETNLHIRAELIREITLPLLKSEDFNSLQQTVVKIGRNSQTRVTVMLTSGKVIADSAEDPSIMEDHSQRPEMAEALNGQSSVSHRYSFTVKRQLMYVAMPIFDGEKIIAVIRLATDANQIAEQLTPIRNRNLLILAVILMGCTALAWVRTRQIVWPMLRMKEYAEKIADKRFQSRMKGQLVLPTELHSVASSLNQIADEYNNNLALYLQKQNEQGAILKCMVEGVIAVDSEETVTHANDSAFKSLNLNPSDYRPKIKAHELIRHPGLQKFIRKSLSEKRSREKEIHLVSGSNERVLFVRSSPLDDGQGKDLGAVFVLSDVTELRKLEKHRQEFVSNVSHELKTPLTSIKGFAETICNPSLTNLDEVKKFSAIIQRHADRLGNLIDDLLTLSKLDKELETEKILMDKVNLYSVAKAAVDCCKTKAAEKNIKVEVTGHGNQPVRGNSTLLEQAIINLVDNAIKYSPAETPVTVKLESDGSFVNVSVIDQGCGVSKEHQERLFERFYRVDQGRSREIGGTGLGLSIVKHIAKAHNGAISVKSQLGVGSIFTLQIPLAV